MTPRYHLAVSLLPERSEELYAVDFLHWSRKNMKELLITQQEAGEESLLPSQSYPYISSLPSDQAP